MPENLQKNTEKKDGIAANASWKGIIRLQVLDILFERKALTITDIHHQLDERNMQVNRRTLQAVINELKGCTLKNLTLNECMVHSGYNAKVPAYFIRRRKPNQ